MVINNYLSCLILSCDKFSDLWSGNIQMFNKNWPNRDFQTYLVTDRPTNRKFDGVEIISAGEGVEWSDRLRLALDKVQTKYVFVTLDDYYLNKKVDENQISNLIELMESQSVDYIKLFLNKRTSIKEAIEGYNKIYRLDTKIEYSVNLYPAIWKVDFMKACIGDPKSAWQFEVGLSDSALNYGAKCYVSLNDEYKFLDVVRKGKLLRSAATYFKKNPGIYDGNRPVNSIWFVLLFQIQVLVRNCIPTPLVPYVMRFLSLFGFKFYSKGGTNLNK